MTQVREDWGGQLKMTPTQWRHCAMLNQSHRPPKEDFSSEAWAVEMEKNPQIAKNLEKIVASVTKTSEHTVNKKQTEKPKRKRGGKQVQLRDMKKLLQQLVATATSEADIKKYRDQITKLNNQNHSSRKKNKKSECSN